MFDTKHCQPCDNVKSGQFNLQGCVTVTMTLLVEECQLIGLKPGGRWLLSSGSAVLYVCVRACMRASLCAFACVHLLVCAYV